VQKNDGHPDATMPPHDLPERNPHVILLLLLNKDLEEHREAWSVKVSCVCYTHERQTSDISSQTGPGAFLVVKTGEMTSSRNEDQWGT